MTRRLAVQQEDSTQFIDHLEANPGGASAPEPVTSSRVTPRFPLTPIFYSRKNHTLDNQRLATTAKPLGTTFSIFSLDSFFLSQGGRQGHPGGQARLVCLAYDLAAQH